MEPSRCPEIVEWAILIALVVVVVLVALIFMGPQVTNTLGEPNNSLLIFILGR